MNRRKFLIGMGSLAAGSAAAMGTGAFTSVSADRSVSVSVTGDASAFLALDATNATNGAYASEQGADGELTLAFGDISSDASRDVTLASGGEGINSNAVTKIEDVFRVRNQGTQPVEVDLKETREADYDEKVLHAQDPWGPESEATLDEDDDLFIWFQDWGDGTSAGVDADRYGHNEVELNVGQQISVMVEIYASPDGTFSVPGKLKIEASADDADTQGYSGDTTHR